MGDRLTFAYGAGVDISYRIVGNGPVPVVFIHGFAAALTTWDDILSLFPTERFTLYLFDLKGFGFSSKPRAGSYSIEEQAAVTAAFLEAKGLSRVVLAGHSLGGAIALLVTLQALDRGETGLVSRLVLIAPSAYPQKLPRLMGMLRIPLLACIGMALIPVRTIVRYTLARVFHDKGAITPERIRRYESCFGRRGMAGVLIRSARAIDPESYGAITSRYGEISVPTLIIWGSEDRIVRIGQGKRLVGEMPDARLAVIDGCGHNPHEERPRETFAVIVDFLGAGG
ncbi:alpha/beta fold hydrolase [Geobacter sp.]|uniref:alpha/beta fold hydrolase n=1 Tax=Geobacter sp. TaxID=46610 RepID=UPI0027B991A8|nr:alpha/beta hydrolase [Geobacter sp.]